MKKIRKKIKAVPELCCLTPREREWLEKAIGKELDYLIYGKLEIEEDEAEIIRLIFYEFVHTSKGYNGIYKYLKEKGFKKKIRHNGNLDYFSEQFVKEVLDNPIYSGKLAFHNL